MSRTGLTIQARLPSRQENKPALAVIVLVLSTSLMVTIALIVKLLADNVPLTQILSFRFLVSVLPLLGVVLILPGGGGWSSLKTRRFPDHLIRAGTGMTGLGLYFFAISEIPLAAATVLQFSAPIFVTLLAILVLGERVGVFRGSAVGAGFFGIVLIMAPDIQTGLSVGLIAGIGSAFFAGFVPIWIRKLSVTEHPITIAIYHNSLSAAVFLSVSLTLGWTWSLPIETWLLLIALGLVASLQQYTLAKAFQLGEASFLAPFEYLALPLSALLGYLVFSEVPLWTTLVGGAIIALGGIVIALREHHRVKRLVAPLDGKSKTPT